MRILLSICITLLLLSKSNAQTPFEIPIYNSLIDSFYRIDYCHEVIKPPFYKCCNISSIGLDSLMACCKKSNILPEYKVYCIGCINESELDTLELIMATWNTLSSLNISEYKKYILSFIPDTSIFYKFVKGINKDSTKTEYNIETLKNNKIKFMSFADLKAKYQRFQYGLSGNKFYIGILYFSRIITNKSQTLGIFKYTYLGGGLCGYDDYVLVYKENNQWKIYKKINYGVY